MIAYIVQNIIIPKDNAEGKPQDLYLVFGMAYRRDRIVSATEVSVSIHNELKTSVSERKKDPTALRFRRHGGSGVQLAPSDVVHRAIQIRIRDGGALGKRALNV